MKSRYIGCYPSNRRAHEHIPLDEMERVVLWEELLLLIKPHAPVATKQRTLFDFAVTLRTDRLQHRFVLSDVGVEETSFETSFFCDLGASTLTSSSLIKSGFCV